jgi:hypothetical protein
MDGYYKTLQPQTCLACPTGCLLCKNGTSCDKCPDNQYYNSRLSRCDNCASINHCLTCQVTGQCTKCSSEQYYLSGGVCEQC